jgi:hypothetical protein
MLPRCTEPQTSKVHLLRCSVLLVAATICNKATYLIQLLKNVLIGIRQEHATGVPMEINFHRRPPLSPPTSFIVKWYPIEIKRFLEYQLFTCNECCLNYYIPLQSGAVYCSTKCSADSCLQCQIRKPFQANVALRDVRDVIRYMNS